jgi:hypothetical protein
MQAMADLRSFRDSPGFVMPLLGAGIGVLYSMSRPKREKAPLVFAALGAGAGVFVGAFMGSFGTGPGRGGAHVGRAVYEAPYWP